MRMTGPFIECPSCHSEEYGVQMIGGKGYSRRCRACSHSSYHELPLLRKKILFLDQMAASNMMFAINPQTKQNREGRVQPVWRELFEKLDVLTRLQVVLCPEGPRQERE